MNELSSSDALWRPIARPFSFLMAGRAQWPQTRSAAGEAGSQDAGSGNEERRCRKSHLRRCFTHWLTDPLCRAYCARRGEGTANDGLFLCRAGSLVTRRPRAQITLAEARPH